MSSSFHPLLEAMKIPQSPPPRLMFSPGAICIAHQLLSLGLRGRAAGRGAMRPEGAAHPRNSLPVLGNSPAGAGNAARSLAFRRKRRENGFGSAERPQGQKRGQPRTRLIHLFPPPPPPPSPLKTPVSRLRGRRGEPKASAPPGV